MAYLGKTPSQAVRSRYYYTATGGETSLSGADDNSNVLTFTDGNYVDVSLNGATLVAGSDYNTTTTNTIGGLAALTASDIVEVLVYDTFSVFGGNMAANLNFKDNVKANFGTGNDLVIYHDGSNSILDDVGTGNLQLQISGSPKLEVTTNGIDVTGTVTADGLTVDTSDQVIINHAGDGGGIRIDSTNGTNTGSLRFGDVADNYIGAVEYNHSTDALSFYANNATRMTIDSSGKIIIGNDIPIWSGSFGGAVFLKGNNATAARNARLCIVDSTGAQDGDKELILDNDGDVTVKGGDLIFGTAGKGIVLGATTNVAANTLDDYEEGTWTPATGGGTAAGGSAAFYIKIGRSVTVMADVTFTGVTSPTHLITGLPFPANGVQTGACIAWNNSSRYLNFLVPTGTSNLSLGNQQSAIENVNDNNRLIFSVTYQT